MAGSEDGKYIYGARGERIPLGNEERNEQLRSLQLQGIAIGADVAALYDTVVKSGDMQYVQLDIPENDPYWELRENPNVLIYASTRSKRAQLRKEIPHVGIAHYTPPDGVNSRPDSFIAVMNHSDISYNILSGAGNELFYLYYRDAERATITGKSLDDMMNKDEDSPIQISGRQGRDWKKWYGTDPITREKVLKGVILRLNGKQTKVREPILEETDIIYEASTPNHTRADIDSHLQVMKRRRNEALWIGETLSEVFLNDTVHGVLDWRVITNGEINDYYRHINSLILIGGKTPRHTIRTEIISPTRGSDKPTDILVEFVKAERLPLLQAA